MATIRTYVKRNEEWREPGSGRSQLFLATVKPHRPVATCAVARWLKTLMGDTGIDTSVYKAHSTCAASTSKAKAQGLSVEQITQKANWSRRGGTQSAYNSSWTKWVGWCGQRQIDLFDAIVADVVFFCLGCSM